MLAWDHTVMDFDRFTPKEWGIDVIEFVEGYGGKP